MTLRTLPEAPQYQQPKGFQCEAPADVLEQWAAMPVPTAAAGDGTIEVFDQIGAGMFTDGVTAKAVSASLRSSKAKDITVKINSPGGNFFEGLAIYNLLRSDPRSVRVEVLGVAASAASVIAMAGDEIVVGPSSFMFVHNAHGVVMGDQHDMSEASAMLTKFSDSMADIYEARSETKRPEIIAMMDKETFLTSKEAVAKGFADSVDGDITAPEGDVTSSNRGLMARRQTEAALARAGFTRDARTELMLEMGVASKAGQRDATGAARDAGKVNGSAIFELDSFLKQVTRRYRK